MAPGFRITGGVDFPYYKFHRWSAIGVVLFFLSRFLLAAYIKSDLIPGLNSYSFSIQLMLALIDSLLVACVFFHSINGLRQFMADLFFPAWYEKVVMRRLMIGTLVLCGILWTLLLSAMIFRLANGGAGGI